MIDELYLAKRGYLFPTVLPSGRLAAILDRIGGAVVVSGFDSVGHADEWSYHSIAWALEALRRWDGNGEPTGWIRHSPSMRRQDERGTFYYHYEAPGDVTGRPDTKGRIYIEGS